MGVHGLWKIIDSSGKAIPLEALENRVLAVDVSIWLYQLVKGFQEASGHSVANAYLLGLFHRICKLLFYRIKPIFVFDGGVPALKRRTIADRQNNRAKANRLGEKLRQTLLENLAKQEALGQVLGESVVIPKFIQQKQDSLFQLPPLPVVEENPSNESSSDSENERDQFRYKDIHSIDITSEEFLSLPPDMRHDILTELKETRKQNSWGRLHLIPKESNEFSDYQMKRLLKRRAVQVGIEQAEGEMGTRGFTISDLQTILSDQGIELAHRIAADSSTRLLYRDKLNEVIKDKDGKILQKLNKIDNRPIKKRKLIEDDMDYYSEIEDDPDYCQESDIEEKEELTQKEILELIKQGSEEKRTGDTPVCKTSVSSRELKNVETKKGGELTVNGEAVENEAGNNAVKLEHGSLPRESSSCQQSSPHPESLSQLSTHPQPSQNHNITESTSISIKKQENHNSQSDTENAIEVETFRPSDLCNPERKINITLDKDKAKQRLEVLNYLNKVKDEISSPLKAPVLSTINTKSENQNEGRSYVQNLPSPIIEKINEIDSSSKESNDFIEISNEEKAMDQEEEAKDISSPLKAPVLSTINTKSENQNEGRSDIQNLPSSIIEKANKIGSSSEESDDDFIEISNEEEAMDVEPEIIKKTSIENNEIPVNTDGTLKEAKPSGATLEIVINSVDNLEDDLFADVFGNSTNQVRGSLSNLENEKSNNLEQKDKINSPVPILNVQKNEILNKDTAQSKQGGESLEPVNANSPISIVMNDTFSSPEVIEKTRPASPVSQLSVEEIMNMKKNLERESNYLAMETNKEERIASTITEQIRIDAQELLQLFGVPYLIAPMEAEAQCAYLDLTGQTQGTITDDSDVWLFGGKNVYKNFFDQKKFVQQFKSTDIAKVLHLQRDEMIMLALLTGSDYTLGLTGVGAVTALEIVAHYPKTDSETTPSDRLKHFAKEFKEQRLPGNLAKKLKKTSVTDGFPSLEVITAYLDPEVDNSSEKFSWSKPNLTELRRYTREKFGWDKTRTDKILEPIFENLGKTHTQGTLHSFFDWKFDVSATQRSKRIENAINIIKNPAMLGEPGPSRERPIKERPIIAPELNLKAEAPVKSKTPAQIAREKAAKKFKELKKQGKIVPKSRKK